MNWFIEHAPKFMGPILEPIPSWGFWEWMQALGALIAVGGFIVLILSAIYRYARQKFGGAVLWGLLRLSTKASIKMVDDLISDLVMVLWFEQKPEQLTAYCFKFTTRGHLFVIAGALLLYMLSGPFDLLVGLSVIGIGCMDLLSVYWAMRTTMSLHRNAKKVLIRAELALRPAEAYISDDSPLHEEFAKFRYVAWHIARVAEVNRRDGVKVVADQIYPGEDADLLNGKKIAELIEQEEHA